MEGVLHYKESRYFFQKGSKSILTELSPLKVYLYPLKCHRLLFQSGRLMVLRLALSQTTGFKGIVG